VSAVCQIHPIVKSMHFHSKQQLIGIPGQYSYRIRSTGGNSHRYGDCEVCGQPCVEVFLQTQMRYYHNCQTLFGHEACLRSQRPLIAREV
jgi:hypothetical protein